MTLVSLWMVAGLCQLEESSTCMGDDLGTPYTLLAFPRVVTRHTILLPVLISSPRLNNSVGRVISPQHFPCSWILLTHWQPQAHRQKHNKALRCCSFFSLFFTYLILSVTYLLNLNGFTSMNQKNTQLTGPQLTLGSGVMVNSLTG